MPTLRCCGESQHRKISICPDGFTPCVTCVPQTSELKSRRGPAVPPFPSADVYHITEPRKRWEQTRGQCNTEGLIEFFVPFPWTALRAQPFVLTHHYRFWQVCNRKNTTGTFYCVSFSAFLLPPMSWGNVGRAVSATASCCIKTTEFWEGPKKKSVICSHNKHSL